MDSTTPRPRQHLAAAAKRYPGAWRAYDDFRQGRGVDLPAWPEWCYCPMAAAYAVVSGGGSNRVPVQLGGDVGRLAAIAAWRVTQGIYRFDPAVYEAVRATPVEGDIPCDVLYHLPEWCVYLETPGMSWRGAPLYGAWAHLEWDVATGRTELRLLLDGEAGLDPIPIHLGTWPLATAIGRALDYASVQALGAGLPAAPAGASETLRQAVEPVVSLLLYLCAEAAEIGDGRRRPTNPAPKRTKLGWRLFPAERTTVWDVGVRLGAALRRAYHASETGQADRDSETGHAGPRAHIRRAHWHTFLAGAGRTVRRLKWLPPIPVKVTDIGNLPATVRPVE